MNYLSLNDMNLQKIRQWQRNMAAVEDDFESWLSLKLKELNTDEGVFGSYIKGILDGDESIEDKTEALEGILTEITDADIPFHCQEILDKWKSSHILAAAAGNEGNPKSLENVEEKLVRLMETNAPSTTVHRNYTDEERRIREAILAHYSQTSDNECDDDDIDDGGGGGGGGGEVKVKENGLFKNTNAAAVQQAEKEKREKAKLDSQKKKEKDKEDREKQKKEQQERKEKRKTQKGERRR